MPGKIRKLEFKVNGDPEIWVGGRGLDRFSRPLSSFRLTNDGFVELLAAMSKEPAAESPFRAKVRRALAAASLIVPDDALEDLITDVVAVYATYESRVFRILKESSPDLRAVHIVQHPSDQRTGGDRMFRTTLLSDVDIEEHVIEEHLRAPLVAVVAPYVVGDTDPVTGAAELGLALAVSRTATEIQLEAILVSVISNLDAFLSSVVEEICRTDRDVLRGSKLSFTALNVLEADGYDELLERIRTEYLRSKTRSFESLNRFFKEVLGEGGAIDAIREFIETRNVLVHHSGRVSQQYLDACPESRYRLDDSLIVSDPYVREILGRLDRLSLSIVTACRDKYVGSKYDIERDSPPADG